MPHERQNRSSQEMLNRIDFLDESLTLTCSFTPEVGEHLPDITDEDLGTKQEHYRILLGRAIQTAEGVVNVEIQAVLAMDDENKDQEPLYSEGKEYVAPKMVTIQKTVTAIKQAIPEYAALNLVGDVHTHPVAAHELASYQHPTDYSSGDLDDLIAEYEAGNISSDKPFIFGIAGRHENQTVYAFYRLVKRDGKYAAVRVRNG